jgi:diguanylate cyclase (GGDEF)-like protein
VKDRHRETGPAQDPGPDCPEQAEFLRECLRRIAKTKALCRYVLSGVAACADARRAELWVLGSSGGALYLKARLGRGRHEPGTRLSIDTGPQWRAMTLGRPVVGRHDATSYAVVPLGARMGVLRLSKFRDAALPGAARLRLLGRMARHAGRALRHNRRLRQAQAASATDALTGLPNRTAFRRDCDRAIKSAARSGKRLAVALIDVDRFKEFNTRFGVVEGGDHALREFARRLDAALRGGDDVVARWGGDEFAALVTGFESDPCPNAVRALERAREAVSARPVLFAGQETAVLTLSAGVAVVGKDEPDAEAALRRAAAALQEAKRQGRDRVVKAPCPDC